ncbi:MAG: hypothetical protein WD649_01865 [Thermoleophilaceae bacterium]
MTLSPRLARLLLPVLVAGVLAAGCGGDDEPASETVPTTAPTDTESTTGKTATDRTATDPDQGGGQSGSEDSGSSGGTRVPDRSRPDSPENDVPPPPGSPAERFEQECQVNPQACQ